MDTDVNTCVQCKFWLWFEDEQAYRCSIKGCWDGSKFRGFDLNTLIAEVLSNKKQIRKEGM